MGRTPKEAKIYLGMAEKREPVDVTVVRRAASAGYKDVNGLIRLQALRELLEYAAWMVDEAVIMAREQNYTWDQIGESFGIGRQALHGRFADRLDLKGP